MHDMKSPDIESLTFISFILFSHFHENNIVKIQVMYIVRAVQYE